MVIFSCFLIYLNIYMLHIYIYKRSILYSQAIRLNSICSEISSYDHRCKVTNWLDYKSLKYITIVRVDFINHQKRYYQWWKLVFDITDLSNFSNVKDIILPIHVFPKLDQDQQKLFGTTPIIDFLRTKNWTDVFVRTYISVDHLKN